MRKITAVLMALALALSLLRAGESLCRMKLRDQISSRGR